MISIILPFHNERESLSQLYTELEEVRVKLHRPFEYVFVDDGSTDGGRELVEKLAEKNSHVVLVRNRKRFGKGASLSRGVKKSKGDIIIFMDADLQNDPNQIELFLKKIDEGYDYVNSIRDSRDDNMLIRSYSKLGNMFVKKFLKSPFTDVNSGFKAMRREIFDDVILYANNFRFMPIAVYSSGYRVTEVHIHNRSRQFGSSKFGTGKVFVGVIDTLTAYFLYQFSERPLHFFGMIGGLVFMIGLIISGILSFERLFFGMLLYRRPMLQLSILLIIVGIQIIMTGFIGELIVYFHKKLKD